MFLRSNCAVVPLKIFLQPEPTASVKKETTTQMFSIEFCEVFNNRVFHKNFAKLLVIVFLKNARN